MTRTFLEGLFTNDPDTTLQERRIDPQQVASLLGPTIASALAQLEPMLTAVSLDEKTGATFALDLRWPAPPIVERLLSREGIRGLLTANRIPKDVRTYLTEVRSHIKHLIALKKEEPESAIAVFAVGQSDKDLIEEGP